MFNSPDEVAGYIRDNDVEFVDVRFCDLPGVMQHFTIPASTFGEDTFSEGLGFDGSSIRGFQAINESDMLLLPDANSAFLDPFRKHKTLNVNFFIHDPITREAYSRDPRNVAKKAEAYLAASGIADTAYFGPEAEFYVFDSVRLRHRDQRGLLPHRVGGGLLELRGRHRARRQPEPRLQGPRPRAATSRSSPTTSRATCART